MAPKKTGRQFNVESYLEDMRAETRVAHREIKDKLDEVAKTVNQHETRITIVENARKTLRWVTGVLVAAAITALVGLFFGLLKVTP